MSPRARFPLTVDAVAPFRRAAPRGRAGESAALVDGILPAGEIVRRIAAEADEVLARVSGRE